MALLVFKDASVVVNAVDLSDHVRSVAIKYEADTPESTTMGATTKTRIPGLLDWSIDVEFAQDYAAAKVDATLFSLVGAAAFTITVKPTSAAVSATNPSFSGSALLQNYEPVSGKVGDLGTAKASFKAAGVLTRATV